MKTRWMPAVVIGVVGAAATFAQAQIISQPAPGRPPIALPPQQTQPPDQQQPQQPQPVQAPGQQSPQVQRTLQHMYPSTTPKFVGQEQINGVHVYHFTLDGAGQGQGQAQITEFGDVLISAQPIQPDRLPQTVGRFLTGLFKKPSEQVNSVIMTQYLADVRVNNQPVRLVIDPAGRIIDILNRQQIEAEDKMDYPVASDEQRLAITPVAQRHIPDAQVRKVMRLPDAPNFFVVEMGLPENRHSMLVMHGANQVVVTQVQIQPQQMPEPVMQSIRELFNVDQLQQAAIRHGVHYYLVQPTAEGQVAIQIKPTGELLSVDNNTAEQAQRAVPAGHVTPPSDQRNQTDEQRQEPPGRISQPRPGITIPRLPSQNR